MPLLQHALLELWKRRHGRWLRAVEYRALGRVKQAIAQTADRLYNELSSSEQERMRDIFVRLTRLDENIVQGEERRDTRRRLSLTELIPAGSDPQDTKALVKRLADTVLVVTSWNQLTQREEVEVAHETLIRHWGRLRGWLDEDLVNLRLRDSISEAAKEWEHKPEDESLLVHRGARLDAATAILDNARFPLTEAERAYIEACRQLSDRERMKAERQRVELQSERDEAVRQRLHAIRQLGNVDWLLGVQARDNEKDFLRSGHFFFRSAKEFQSAGESAQAKNATLAGELVSRALLCTFCHDGVDGAVFSHDESRILTWGADGSAQLWAVGQNEPIQTFQHEYGEVGGAVFSHDESRILTWGAGRARLWAVGQNEPIQTFGDEGRVNGAVFSHDESRILTWSADGRARLWAVGQNEPIQTFEHEEWEWARGAVFNHDESRILTWSGDGTARLWDIRLDENIPPDERILDFQVRSATNLYGSVSLKYLSFDERAAASQTLQEMRSTRAHSK